MPRFFNKKPKATKAVDKDQDKRIRQLENKINNEELKFQEAESLGGTLPAIGSVDNLVPIGQGITNSTRIGNKITVKRIQLKCILTGSVLVGAADQNDPIRVCIVQDKESDGAEPTYANVFGSSVYNFQNLNSFPKRFKILYDKTIVLSVQDTTTDDYITPSPWIELDKKYKRGINVYFDGANATDVQRNSLFLMMKSDSANQPTVYFRTRVSYTDA